MLPVLSKFMFFNCYCKHFYPREINEPAKSLYIQHIEIMKGKPKIKITATPIIDGLPLIPKTKKPKKSKKSKITNNKRSKNFKI